MYFKRLIILFLISSYIFINASQIYMTVRENKKINQVLNNLETVEAVSKTACVASCLQHEECNCVNFKTETRECSLNTCDVITGEMLAEEIGAIAMNGCK